MWVIQNQSHMIDELSKDIWLSSNVPIIINN